MNTWKLINPHKVHKYEQQRSRTCRGPGGGLVQRRQLEAVLQVGQIARQAGAAVSKGHEATPVLLRQLVKRHPEVPAPQIQWGWETKLGL